MKLWYLLWRYTGWNTFRIEIKMSKWGGVPKCPGCDRSVYPMEQTLAADRKPFHVTCIKCQTKGCGWVESFLFQERQPFFYRLFQEWFNSQISSQVRRLQYMWQVLREHLHQQELWTRRGTGEHGGQEEEVGGGEAGQGESREEEAGEEVSCVWSKG